MESQIELNTFQELPLELQYLIAREWDYKELLTVIELYNNIELDFNQAALREYLIYLKRLYHANIYELAAEGDIDTIKYLNSKGKDVLTPGIVEHAALSGNLELIKWLRVQGANITTLQVLNNAISSKNWNLIQWLLDNGACFNEKKIAISAIWNDDIRMLEYLHDNDYKFGEEINIVLYTKNLDVIKYLIDIGYGEDLLIMSIDDNDVEIIKLLVSLGVNIRDVIDGDDGLITDEMIEFFISHGVDPTK